MPAIENIQNQINSLSIDDWNRFFNMIPEIEQSKTFGIIRGGDEIMNDVIEMPYWDWTTVTQKFVKTMYDIKLVLNFDWGAWKEGSELLKDDNTDFENLDAETLCKLLTSLIRADRFNDGLLVANFENGKILIIVNALKHKIMTPPITNSQMTQITEQQEKFIWLAHAEGVPFSEIEKILNVPRSEISKWEIELRPIWQEIAAIKKIHSSKEVKLDFKTFHDWIRKMNQNKKCVYCEITETEIAMLYKIEEEKDEKLTKRSRGRKLELDRKEPNMKYENLENLVYACYWCNNAKTDTFTHEEFKEVGKVISNIWKKRLSK